MSIYLIKPKFQSILRPMVNRLAGFGITANQVTVLALVISVSSAFILYSVNNSVLWGLMPIVLFVRMALNAIDGMLAREHNMASPLGFALNEVCDLLSDAAIYLSFFAVSGFNGYALFCLVLLAWLSEVVAIIAFHIKQVRANHGPLGKSDRAFLFGLLALLIALGIDFTTSGTWILISANIALIFTIYQRLQFIR